MIINPTNFLKTVPFFGMAVTLCDNAWKIDPFTNYPLIVEDSSEEDAQQIGLKSSPSWFKLGQVHDAKLYLSPLSKILYLAAKVFVTGVCFIAVDKFLESHLVTPLLSIGHGPDLDLPSFLQTASQVIGLVVGWITSYAVTGYITDPIVANLTYRIINPIDFFGPVTGRL